MLQVKSNRGESFCPRCVTPVKFYSPTRRQKRETKRKIALQARGRREENRHDRGSLFPLANHIMILITIVRIARQRSANVTAFPRPITQAARTWLA